MDSIIEYGLCGVTSYTTYENGRMEECRLSAYNLIPTKYGKLVPQYNNPGIRRKDTRALSFYKSGNLKSISLDSQTEIKTSIGIFPAELLTFYENGALDSLFPLNGQISFSWSEEEEGQLAKEYDFDFPFGKFTAKISGLRFYQDGSIRSLILWPGEVIEINTPSGKLPVRIGFKLYEDGSIESVEPAKPVYIKTPIGYIKTFDAAALAVDADRNSLRFDQSCNLISLTTSGDILIENKIKGVQNLISPKLRPGLMEDDYIKIPVKFLFYEGRIIIENGMEKTEYAMEEYKLNILYDDSLGEKPCYGDCSGCEGCS